MKNYLFQKQILAMMLCIFLFPSIVGAHAYLDRSIPIQESQLDESPVEIRVKFTEPINTKLSRITLKDENGNEIPGNLHEEGNLWLILDVPPLDNGVYRVYWQVLSLDTHITDGSFRFSVGVELPALRPSDTISIDEFITNSNQTNQEKYKLSTYLRIVELFIAMSIAGLFFFRKLIMYEQKASFITERKVYLVSAIVFFISGLTQVFIRSLQLSQHSWQDMFFTILLTTNIGITSWIQPLLLLVLFALTFKKKENVFLKILLFMALFYAFAWSGHAVQNNMILSHMIHMIAATVWFGGIIGFVVYSFKVNKDSTTLEYLHKKLILFAQVALGSFILITLSGLLLSSIYLNDWNELLESKYGLTLLLKLIAFSPILIIAVCHRFIWLPRLRRGDESSVNKLFWGLRLELFMAIIVILIAGLLSTTSPPVKSVDEQNDHHKEHGLEKCIQSTTKAYMV